MTPSYSAPWANSDSSSGPHSELDSALVSKEGERSDYLSFYESSMEGVPLTFKHPARPLPAPLPSSLEY